MTRAGVEEGTQKLQLCEVQLDLGFTDLSYNVPLSKGKTKKQILRNVNGAFYHGKLTAILGPSGAGKSSLLNILSGFRTRGVTGNVMVNGFPRDPLQFRRHSCYITQECAMLTNLTTHETLVFIASLRLDRNMSRSKKLLMITGILELLGLQNVADTLVGNLSGGEKKRLSVAQELLRNVPVMFFDEPTSGLDSSSCLQVITHLKKLAQNGRTVVCSIHQPSSRIFGIFDDIFLLSEGQCLYRGSVTEMTSALAAAGFPCPTFYNPADFAIEVASGERGCTESLATFYNVNEVEPGNGSHDNAPMLAKRVDEMPGSTPLPRGENLSFPLWYQYQVLFRRSLLCTFRDLQTTKLRLTIHVLVGLLLGGMYYGVGNEASKIYSNTGCVFFFIMFIFYANSLPGVLTYPSESSVFVREHHNNFYSIGAYFLSKFTADLPLQVLCPTAFLIAGYFLTDQPTDGIRFLQFWLVIFFITVLGQTVGLAVGAVFDAQLGVFVVPAVTIPLLLFSGFFMNLRDIPIYFRWLAEVSYFRHSFEAAMVTIYGYNRPDLQCSLPYCHFKSASKYLEEFAMDQATYSYDMLHLMAWIVALQGLIFGTLTWRLRVTR